jgi:aspartyl-tRNA(Asn)/glutamyl-tRNA(Gln) amidotransferase subunit B
MIYEPVIGLEVHVQLNTESKIFCSCSTRFKAGSNTQTCPICLGLPGVLPMLNREAIKKGIMAGMALNCTVSHYSKFDRKNYFYPDLPKSYQISQYDMPVCSKGFLEIDTPAGRKKIGITRLHIEEDAGKSIHSDNTLPRHSSINLNRTGIPLAEIVSEPDIASSDEAYSYLQNLKLIMRYLEVSDCNMEEGSLRCDVNISVRKKGSASLGDKVEIKNLNSFKAVKQSIEFEINRQVQLVESGLRIVQETRLWDADKNVTSIMRSKEMAHDYRYFPEPDIPPVIVNDSFLLDIMSSIPELPHERKMRFIDSYGLSEYDAGVLTSTRQLADYYESVVGKGVQPKKAANWILSELLARVDDHEKLNECPVSPVKMAALIRLVENGTINGKIAKIVFEEMVDTGKDPETIVNEKGLLQVIDEAAIEILVLDVIGNNSSSVSDYKAGKDKALKFLVGQVMKNSQGKANPQLVNELLLKKLRD